MKKKAHFTNIVWKEGKYYVAQCLNIDVSSFGKSKNEALQNLQEALALYLEDEKPSFVKIGSPSIVVGDMQYA